MYKKDLLIRALAQGLNDKDPQPKEEISERSKLDVRAKGWEDLLQPLKDQNCKNLKPA